MLFASERRAGEKGKGWAPAGPRLDRRRARDAAAHGLQRRLRRRLARVERAGAARRKTQTLCLFQVPDETWEVHDSRPRQTMARQMAGHQGTTPGNLVSGDFRTFPGENWQI